MTLLVAQAVGCASKRLQAGTAAGELVKPSPPPQYNAPRPPNPPSSVALDDSEDVEELRDWLASAFDYMAMGK